MQIVLAYPGDSIPSFCSSNTSKAGHDVVAMTLNLGESTWSRRRLAAALEAVRQKASTWAERRRPHRARERFVEEYAIRPGGERRYQGTYRSRPALAPADADLLVEIAEKYGYDAVRTRLPGKGNRSGPSRSACARRSAP